MDTQMRSPAGLRAPQLAVWAAAVAWSTLGLWAFTAAVPVAASTAGFGAHTTTVVVTSCTTVDRGETVEIRCTTADGRTVLGVPRIHRPGDRVVVATVDGSVHARSLGRLGMNLIGMLALLALALLPLAELIRAGRADRTALRDAVGRTATAMVVIALLGIVIVTVMSLLD
jgi:hypothetical protein